jgi:GDPmannose 4,6-dehydratase
VKAIIFGINGQDGKLLSSFLKKISIDVIGISRSSYGIIGDIVDFSFVKKIINDEKPEYIFHFAANSSTSHNTLFDNHNAISTGTINILEAVKIYSPYTKIFLSGSALQFKNYGLPIDENSIFDSSSAYSLARIHSTYAGRYYRASFGLQIYNGFFFNHDSEYRSEKHINQKIVSVAKRISSGSIEKLNIGNIEVLKEFNYAGDVVEAVWKLVNQTNLFEVVIGCGEVHSIREWAEYCFNKVNLNLKDHLVINENFKSEYKILKSNPRLIYSIGWQPKVKFHQLADLMMKNI